MLVACGSNPPPQIQEIAPPATAAPDDSTHRPTASEAAPAKPECADAADCLDKGVAAYEGAAGAKDQKRARELFLRSCDLNEPQACFNLGLMHHRGDGVPKDPARARTSFERACKLDHATGCSNLAIMKFKGDGGATDQPGALVLFERACNLGEVDGCFNVGVGYLKGEGIAEDEDKALAWMKRACKAGKHQGCVLAKEIEKERSAKGADDDSSSAGISGANLTMEATTVNDLKAKNLSCRLDGGGGGLFASIAVLAGLAERKDALQACVSQPAAPRIHWSFSSSSGVTKIEVSEIEGRAKACIQRAVKGMDSAGSGECVATLLLEQ